MRVYMINPPAYEGVKIVREGRCMQRKGAWTAVWTPVSLAYCASVLRKAGHQVALSDCIVEEIDFEMLKSKALEFKPDLAIINTATPSIASDIKTNRVLKEALPDIKTAFIGIHVTALPEDVLSMDGSIDYLIRGEPEMTALELAEAIEHNKPIANIKGISYLQNGKPMHNPPREPLRNLDDLPFPAYDLIEHDKYIMPFLGKRFLLIATGRGCPYRCNFCADTTYYGHKLNLRSPSSIADEMEWAIRSFNINHFLFWSESFTINQRFAEAVADEIIARKLDVHWVCNSRVDNVNPRMLGKFKQAGCWMVGYGIESGSQRVLELMNKKTTLDDARQAVKWTKQAGLEVTGHCVIGYPGETEQEIWQTLRFAIELDLDFAQFYCAVPFPGSELYETAREGGLINNRDWTFYEQNFSVFETEQLSSERIMELRSKLYRRFYFRPRMFYKTLKRIRSARDISLVASMFKDFLTWI